ncbi:DUF1080 domain-containing protein [Aerophototrophica crusticola]|uniref:DUF1080 domain-containing protein n=1 Tax=Aerophototrophica crusticola TaxID=1709002 RepID=A0A858R5I9_9PROT|nr:DUF1080 domain-containing protein [Rhodospirillaceae bacterium B3]
MPTDKDFLPLLTPGLPGWRMAGAGGFLEVGPGTVESRGGPGLFWFADAVFADFVLVAEWRCQGDHDNSGIFLRSPPLADSDKPAIEQGYEIQIDDRGVAPDGSLGSPLHLTGAVYSLVPVTESAFRPTGDWNRFEVKARGGDIGVVLNGRPVCHLTGGNRRREGHVALQAHHDGSRVQFRDLRVARL